MRFFSYIINMNKRNYNKEKQKLWSAKHYSENKVKMIEKAKLNNQLAKDRNKRYIKDYLSTHPCIDCGNNNIIVLEFDHISNDKKHNISNMSSQAYSLQAIQEEINKCEVRCANCHRIATHNRRLS